MAKRNSKKAVKKAAGSKAVTVRKKGNGDTVVKAKRTKGAADKQPKLSAQKQRADFAEEVIRVIAGEMPKAARLNNNVTVASERATLRNTSLLAKGIIVSAFCRSGHVQVMLPALGKQVGLKQEDRAGNPFVTFPLHTAKAEARKLAAKIVKALKA